MAARDTATRGQGPSGDVNVVVIVGEVSRDATVTETGDGCVFTSFDVVCRVADGRTVVPVTLEADQPLAAGTRVAVFGAVNKRFYASGAGLAARTDVRADRVTVVRRPAQLVRLMQVVADDLLGR